MEVEECRAQLRETLNKIGKNVKPIEASLMTTDEERGPWRSAVLTVQESVHSSGGADVSAYSLPREDDVCFLIPESP
uniref:Uncharacterized protein n=1 Tax=Chromera velia CCMP2878 TaxID=1169474 RepID=A0A0G4HRH8_9ALVE|eukprot:Cvel_30620.t1-p1 / transcript=Cvel_30620.t1 / gene=Cvel_30620 / organism=Chromera_velia_CCMP2878 / gene_product=hypothetical protein / transcript_product=hypothetical protein / location=Cvel_scaffold4397:3457-3684(-) / protein_length=76 / sequence_SO=supercontig / SO=protein_coding / is_pseudo=false